MADTKKNLPLLRAVKEGKLSTITALIDTGDINVNFQNHYGDTALILAAWYGHVDITRLLLDAEADVDATNCDGNCALNCAAYHGFMEVASLLVDANATIDVRDNVTGKTALIKAAYVGHADVAEVLLRSGADRNAMDNQGYSALAFSTSFNHIGVLDVLLRAKADPNVQDEFGITPLIHSAARGYADAVEMLLKAGAKPGLMDMEGKNALDYAESAEFDEVVAMLSACDDGPSVCATFRGGDGSESSRLPGSGTGPIGGAAPSSYRADPYGRDRGDYSSRADGGNSPPLYPGQQLTDRGQNVRMTPRVPLAGEVSSRLTPRGNPYSGSGGLASGRGSSRTTTPQAYRGVGGNGRVVNVSPKDCAGLERDKMLYLAKKLVHLSILLEQDTVTDDALYPSFHGRPGSP